MPEQNIGVQNWPLFDNAIKIIIGTTEGDLNMTNYKSIYCTLIQLLLLCSLATTAAAGNFNVEREGGPAIHGYDPVAYFNGTAVKGATTIKTSYQGATFYFSDTVNRDKFQTSPDKYAPQFGGHCAYGVRMGKKLDVDPEVYAVLDGKLYLLLNRATKEVWDQDRARNIAIANSLWPSLKPAPSE